MSDETYIQHLEREGRRLQRRVNELEVQLAAARKAREDGRRTGTDHAKEQIFRYGDDPREKQRREALSLEPLGPTNLTNRTWPG